MNIQKLFPTITLLLAGLVSTQVQAVNPNICYAISDKPTSSTNGDTLMSISQSAGTPAVELGPIFEGTTRLETIESMTTSLDGNTIYAVDERNQSGQPDGKIGVFGTVALDGTFTRLSPSPTGIGSGDGDQGIQGFHDVDGMAIDPRTGMFYGTVRTMSSDGVPEDILFRIDPATGIHIPDAFGAGVDYVTIDTSSLGLGINDVDDIAIDPTDGQLYGIATISGGAADRIILIDKATGSVTDVGQVWYDDNGNSVFDAGEDVNDVEGLSVFNDGTLYATTGSTNNFTNYGAMPESLFTVNNSTAEMAHIAEFGLYEDYESVACLTGGANTISGLVFNDLNIDGIFNGSDVGTKNIAVSLYIDENNDGSVDLGDTLLLIMDTDNAGNYNFETAIANHFVIEIDKSDPDFPPDTVLTTDNVEEADFNGFGLSDIDNNFGWANGVDMQIVKTVNDESPNEGDTIVYTLTITNNGPLDATGVVVTDTLPAGVSWVSTIPSQGNCSVPSGITCELGAMAKDDVATITITATVNSGLGDTALLTNTAIVSANEVDPVSSNNTDTADIITCPAGEIYNFAMVSSSSSDGDLGNNSSDVCTEVIRELDISGVIYNDTDGDGDLNDRLSQGGAETALAGPSITVTLYLDDGFGNPGAFVDSVVTTDGTYAFLSQSPNDYVIVATTPAGYTSTNDVDPPNDDTIVVSLVNANLVEQDFLDASNNVAQIGEVRGRVIDDADGDGDLSERQSEGGISGVTVELWYDTTGNGEPDTVFDTTLTDAQGKYTFTNVPPGDYWVVETDPGGYTSTNDTFGPNDNVIPITRVGSADSKFNDFLDAQITDLGSIGDTVYNDVNGNGQPDAGEGIAGVTVWIDYDGDGVVDTNEPSDVTAGDGTYLIEDLPVGNFSVKVLSSTLPGGLTPTVDPDEAGICTVCDEQTLISLGPHEDNLTADFGYAGTGSIGDKIFEDLNSDGDYDAGEGLQNVVVYIDANGNGIRDPGEQFATTDADGTYLLDGLAAGTYDVKVDQSTVPDGLGNTVDPDGGNNNAASVTITANENNTTTDFGYEMTGSVSGRVYDVSDNSALAGVKVVLKDSGGTIIAETFTDATGNYQFEGLVDGTYSVVVDPDGDSLPSGAVNSVDPEGSPGDEITSFTISGGNDVVNRDFGYTLDEKIIKSVDIGDGTAADPEDVLTYSLTPNYSGSTLLGSVQISDVMPPGTTYNGNDIPAADSEPSVGATGTIIWELGSNDPGVPGNTPGTCTGYADTLVSSTGVPNANGVLGAPDAMDSDPSPSANAADLYDTGDQIVIDLSDELSIGAVYTMHWRRALNTSDNPTFTIEESPDNSTWTAASGSPFLVSNTTYHTVNITAGVITRYLRITTTNIYNIDIDAVSYVSQPCEGATAIDTSSTTSRTLVASGEMFKLSLDIDNDSSDTNLVPDDPNLAGNQTLVPGVTSVSCTGPTPAAGAPLIGGVTLRFEWDCTPTATSPGEVSFTLGAVGDNFSYPAATSNSVLSTPPLTFQVKVDSAAVIDVEQIDNRASISYIIHGGDHVDATSNEVSNPVNLNLDYGDLPDSGVGTGTGNYQTQRNDDGPRHIIGGSYLGSNATDSETDGQQNATASGDDSDGNDDEDGVVFGTLLQGESATITVTSSGTSVLNAWADWNGDGVFNEGEQIFSDEPLSAGNNQLTFNVLPGAPLGDTAIRFRVTDTTGQGGDSPTGLATTGEVEDYIVPVTSFVGTSSIEGQVRDDIDADGDLVDVEPGVAGVNITLFWDNDGNGVYDGTEPLVDTTTTDVNGNYLFDNLADLEYLVVETNPIGTTSTADKDGNTNGNGFDTILVDLTGGGTSVDNDFLDASMIEYAIGDMVWIDTDGDGIQDIGEPGLVNVDVMLYRDDDGIPGPSGGDTLLGTQTTDANGNYLFTGEGGGDFYTAVDNTTLPAGLKTAPGTTDPSAVISITGSGEFLDLDFGYVGLTSTLVVIGDRVWSDANADGVQDPGEVGIAGVTLTLIDAVTGIPTAYTTTTGPSGQYLFTEIPEGSYRVQIDATNLDPGGALEGYDVTSGPQSEGSELSSTRILLPGDIVSDLDFGYVADTANTYTIADTIFFDISGEGGYDPDGRDGNPATTDDNEFGIGGVTVNLLDVNGNVVATTRTSDGTMDIDGDGLIDPAGEFAFTGVPDGMYTIEIADNANELTALTGTSPPATSYELDITVAGGDIDNRAEPNFGYNVPGGIGDTIYSDSNGDGDQDPGELGIAGVTVELYRDSNGNGSFDPGTDLLVGTEITDGLGNYLFDGQTSGTYFVSIPTGQAVLGGYVPTGDPDEPGAGCTVCDEQGTVVLASNSATYLAADFGYQNTSLPEINGSVWNDLNENAAIDPGEPDIEGVTIALVSPGIVNGFIDINGDGVITAADDGNYGGFTVTDGVIAAADGTIIYGMEVTSGGLDVNGDGFVNAADDRDPAVIATTTTDANGDYTFNDVPPGSYSVNVTDTAEVLKGYLLTSGLDEIMVTVAGIDVNNIDFGYARQQGTGSIGDSVWLDSNGDGVQSAAEAGISGVALSLYTDRDDDGTVDTTVNVLGNALDLNGDGVVNANDQGYWFGIQVLDGGLDVNGDGLVNASDNGTVNGYTITAGAIQTGNGAIDGAWDTTVTDASGTYLFGALPAGEYYIDVTGGVPAGLQLTTGSTDPTATISLGEGVAYLDADIGYTPNAGTVALGDTVWYDANSNGLKDPGEAGIGGVDVQILNVNTGVITTVTTNPDGSWVAAGLPAGDEYIVTVDDATLPPGLITTPTNMGGGDTYNTDPLPDGTVLVNLDFGFAGGISGSIGDTVWLDSNGDGDRDAGEAGLSGVALRLWSTGPDGVANTADDFRVASTHTDANGEYLFTGLFDGEYYVEVVSGQSGLDATDDSGMTGAGNNAANGQTDEIALIAGDHVTNADFGYQPNPGKAVIGDRIWSDADGDGVQDAGEAGIGGVKVFLCLQTASPCNAGNATKIAVTAADGSYRFTDVDPDDYTVAVDLTTVSGVNTGDPDEVGPCNVCDSQSDITAVADTIYTDLDFGYQDTAAASGSIGDFVYHDVDGNGAFDGTDVGVDGVTLSLSTVAIINGFVDINGDGLINNADNGAYAGYNVYNGGIDTSGNGSVGPEDTGTIYGFGVIDGRLDINGDLAVDDLDDQGSQLIATTTTAGGGAYDFTGLPAGDYRVLVTDTNNVLDALLDSRTATQSAPTTITIACGGSCTDADNADFGYTGDTTANGSIGDLVCLDSDGDGSCAGESGISGVSLDLFNCGTGTCNDGDEFLVSTQFTNSDGAYDFTGLPAGNYEVVVTDTNGVLTDLLPSNDPGEVTIVCMTPSPCTDWNDADFAFEPTLGDVANLGGTLWRDTIKPGGVDGTLQPAEPRIQGVTVELWLDTNGDGIIQPGIDNLVRTTQTDINGDYNFLGLPPDNYIVRVPDDDYPDVWGNFGTNGALIGMMNIQGPAPNADNNGHFNEYAVTLSANETNNTVDFAYEAEMPYDISGLVFEDANGDGSAFEPGDALVPNAMVALYRVVNGIEYLVDVTSTLTDGTYSFIDLPPGTYTVVVDTAGTVVDGFEQTVDPDEVGQCVTCDSQGTVIIVAADEPDVNFAYWNGGVVTTPVSLGYFHAQSTDVPGEVYFEWSTVTEAGNLAFDLYVEGKSGVLIRVNEYMVPAQQGRPLERRNYEFLASGIYGEVFYIVDTDIKGVETQHGPFRLDVPAGVKETQAHPTDMRSIREEHDAKRELREESRKDKMKEKLEKRKQKLMDKGRWNSQNDSEPGWAVRLAGGVLSLLVSSAQAQELPIVDTGLIHLKVDQSGVQRVTYEELAAAGLDLDGADPDLIALTNRGEPVPLWVDRNSGGRNNKFGPHWYIEFLGEALDSLYSRDNVYALYLDEVRAERISEHNRRPPNNVNPVPWYLQTDRIEQDAFWSFAAPGGDPWYMEEFRAIVDPLTRNFEFTIDAYPGDVAPAGLKVELWGVTDWPSETDDHHVEISLNGDVLADEWFDGLVDYPVQIDIPAGNLVEGANDLSIHLPLDTGFIADLVTLNGFAVTYPRAFRSRDGNGLQFRAAGELFEVTGLSSAEVAVFREDDASGVTRITRLEIDQSGDGSYTVRFQGILSEAQYEVITLDAMGTPALVPAPEDTDITTGPADYLVIAHPDFIGEGTDGLDSLGALVEARQAEGYNIVVADLDQVYSQFGYGIVDPQAIRDYIAYAQAQMGTQMVLLVGGDTLDYLGNLDLPDAPVSFVPSLYAQTGPIVHFAPVDPLYTDVTGDEVPDLAIGRFPVRSSEELTQIVGKTLGWNDKDYDQTALFVADNEDPANGLDFSADSDDMITRIPPAWQAGLDKAYMDDLDLAGARQLTLDKLNEGVALTSFVGHSAYSQWSFDGLFTGLDAAGLINNGRPSVVTQWGCWNTFFVSETEDTMGHEFLLNGDQGAVAVLGASTLTDAPHERELGKLLYDYLFVQDMPLGVAIQQAKEQYALSAPGHKDVILGWTLLGDPALVMQQ